MGRPAPPAALNSTFVVDNVEGFASVGFFLTIPTGGAITFEGTFDGINWDSITFRSISDDEYVQARTSGGDFIGSISTLKSIRFRTSTVGSAPGSVTGRLGYEVSTLEGIEFANRPDKFGGVDVHIDFSSAIIQLAATVWDPGATRKFVVTDALLFVHGVVDGTFSLFRETDSSGNYLIRGFMDPSVNSPIVIPMNRRTPFKALTAGHKLKVTTTSAINFDLSIGGYTIPG